MACGRSWTATGSAPRTNATPPRRSADTAGSANAEVLAFSLRFAIARAAGSTAALDRDVERVLGDYDGYPAADGMRAVHLLLTGRNDQARRLLHRRMSAGIESIPRDSEWLEALWNLGEVAAALAELEAVEAIHDALVPYADLWAVDGVGAACYGAVSHQLGRLSIALDRHEEAERFLEAADTPISPPARVTSPRRQPRSGTRSRQGCRPDARAPPPLSASSRETAPSGTSDGKASPPPFATPRESSTLPGCSNDPATRSTLST